MGRHVALRVVLGCLLMVMVLSDERTHRYRSGEILTLWSNWVAPYHNPSEAYPFFSLPYCRPSGISVVKQEGLGSMLEGNRVTMTGITLSFLENLESRKVCDIVVDNRGAQALEDAVQRNMWFQLLLDELPMYGLVGKMACPPSDGQRTRPQLAPHVYSHFAIVVSHNGNHIVDVSLQQASPVLVRSGATIPFTVSVKWAPSTAPFRSRSERYLDFNFFENKVHWFWLVYSFVVMCCVVGLVVMVLLKTGYCSSAQLNDDVDQVDLTSTSSLPGAPVDSSAGGWRALRKVIFRAPSSTMLLSSLIGTGFQLAFLVGSQTFLSMLVDDNITRGRTTTRALVLFSIMSAVGGYASAAHYRRYRGTSWLAAAFLTGLLLPGLSLTTLVVLNVWAVAYQTLAVLTFWMLVKLVGTWLFLSCPLLMCGSVVGSSVTDSSRRPEACPPEAPSQAWYHSPAVVSLAAGVLPFAVIFTELFYLFAAFWLHKVFYVYAFLLLTFGMFVVVSAGVGVLATFVLLNAQSSAWQWLSFRAGATTGLYVFLYATYFYYTQTYMSGMYQFVFYFGYSLLFSAAIGCMGGAMSFFGAEWFIFAAYSPRKYD